MQSAALPVELAPVTVTGEKISRTLEETQSSVVVVTEQQLREKADRDLADVFARTPGVYNQSGNENWGSAAYQCPALTIRARPRSTVRFRCSSTAPCSRTVH
ncbi:hypothetical protein D9M68_943670 [compost metagenome]